jgi:hypothetical protein
MTRVSPRRRRRREEGRRRQALWGCVVRDELLVFQVLFLSFFSLRFSAFARSGCGVRRRAGQGAFAIITAPTLPFVKIGRGELPI